MSLVVAIKTDKGIVMGCDSQVSYGNNKYSLNDASCKIWDIINCPYGLMGSVGFLRDSQLISAHAIINPERVMADNIDFDYVVCELYSCLCDILASYHRISLEPAYDKDGVFIPPVLNNEFIFAYKDDAYQISQEGCVRYIDDFLVIGSGAEIATGVLDNNKNKSPEERIIEAISTCNTNTLYIDNNITLFYTYEEDCENMDCEECGRNKYCQYYLSEQFNNEDVANETFNDNIKDKHIEENSLENENKKTKRIRKPVEPEQNKNENIIGKSNIKYKKHYQKHVM